MKKLCRVLFNVAVMAVVPGIAGAAGTYYNSGVYQQRYGTGYNRALGGMGYGNRYAQQQTATRTTTTRTTTTRRAKSSAGRSSNSQNGFVLGAGLAHEFASWDFNMNAAGSDLHYDNLRWNVFDAYAAWRFGNSVPMQIKVGGRYGMQFDESSMVDDDISQGGYLAMTWTDKSKNIIGYQTGHALSVGTSKGGDQMGFNASFGFTDLFKSDRVKIGASFGYRYLKYKLTTQQNYGVAIDILESTGNHPYATCISGYLGEIQCDPFLLFYSTTGDVTITGREEYANGEFSDIIQMPGLKDFITEGVSTGGTYYYEQSGTSHEYKTSWAGPYVALDMEYYINDSNTVSGGMELGLPIYSSEGNQPYRYDWAHPKSVEDEGGFGDAIHVGLNANWKTFITDSFALTLGLTYDYYSVSDATAKTYLNADYYTSLYEKYYDYYTSGVDDNGRALSEYQMNMLVEELNTIADYSDSGWVLESSKEINSVYRSMGIRLGVDFRF